MLKTRKILSLALTLALVLSAIFCTGAVANAEITTATYPTSAKAISLSLSTTEAAMDWSSLEHLTDSTQNSVSQPLKIRVHSSLLRAK